MTLCRRTPFTCSAVVVHAIDVPGQKELQQSLMADRIRLNGVTSVTVGSLILPESEENYGIYAAIDKLLRDASLGNLKDLVVYELNLLGQDGNSIENFTGEMKVEIKKPQA